jgi:thiamine biosynthesis lipoprotein
MVGRLASVVAILLNLHSSSVSGQGVPHRFREVHLGLEVTILAHGAEREVAQAATAAFARIAALEQTLSDWRSSSELNQVTIAASDGDWHPISADLDAVLRQALQVAAATDGAFDPTVGALTRLWREARRTGAPIDPVLLRQAQHTVGWRGVQLDHTELRLRLTTAGVRLDLGGIAKGWILDQARAVMATHRVTAVLLEAGGDIVAGDPPPGAPGWRINVRTNSGDSVLVLQRAAVATSGPSAQVIVDALGNRRSHVLDPASGLGLDNGVEVTVIAADGATADAVATALTVMPESKWDGVLDRFGGTLVAVLIVTGDP